MDSAVADGAHGQLVDGLALRALHSVQTPAHHLPTGPLDSSPDFVLRPAHSHLDNCILADARTTVAHTAHRLDDDGSVSWFFQGSHRSAVLAPSATLRARQPDAATFLTQGGHSRAWGGPVATVVKEPDDWVEGVLYALPRAELALLDRFEGHPFAYQRKLLFITDETGRRRRAWVYVLPLAEEAPPAPDYLGVLWRAYQRLGFDRAPLAAARGGVR